MIVFASAAGVLLLVSMALVLGPLWWGKQAAGSRKEANVVVYEQHVAEIERELMATQITADEAAARRNELDAQLLSDVDDAPQASVYTTRRPWIASTAVVVGFAVFAIGMYSLIGDTRGLTPQKTADIAGLVAKMKTRLATVPDDLRTRALLGQVQMAQSKYGAAAQTFAELNASMGQPDALYLLAEARARVLDHGGKVDERAHTLYKRVLTLSPNNVEALWFTGLAALSDGKPKVAAERWQHLLRQDIPDPFRAKVGRRLAEVQGEKPSLKFGN